MFDFSQLLDIHYLVESNPGSGFAFKNLFLLVFGLIMFISVLVWLTAQFLVKKSRLLRNFLQTKVFYLLLTLGLGGLALTFFRLTGAAYLSMRLIFLIFILGMLAWAIYLIFYLIVSFPKERREEIDQKRREKYLPKKVKSKK